MRFIGLVCACLMGMAPSAFAAKAAKCVPQKEMQEIAKHFEQFADLAKSDYCYDGSHTANLIEALEFMRNNPYAASMPKSTDELFSGTFANDWYGYFTGRITDISIQKSCPKGVGAFVYFFGTTMYVCPMLLTENFTAVDRTSVMMHEARHIDGYPHMMCTRGPRAGLQGACDNRMSDHGSYGVSVETYAQLGAYATDLHPALKAYARSAAIVYADEAFQHPVQIQRTPHFLLMTNNKEFYRLSADGSTQITKLGDSPSLGHIVMRSRHMILYPDDKSLPAKYVFAKSEGDIQQAAGDMAVEYNAQTPAQRAELADMHLGGQWTARVYRSKVVFNCDPKSSDTEDVALKGTPASLIYPDGYDRSAESALLVMDDGSVQELGCSSGAGYAKASNVKLDQKYKRIYKSGNQVLGLTADGRLFQIQGASSTALQTSVDGRVHELVPNETFNFFENSGS